MWSAYPRILTLLTNQFVNSMMDHVPDVAVIDEPEAARAILAPLRSRILAALATPGSASSVAEDLGLPRQKVNYHLRLLEEHGFISLVEERQRRGLVERVMVATATSYALSPKALGECSTDPANLSELSSSYLIAVGARLVDEVGTLAQQASAANKPLATLAIDTEIRFASAQDRADFANDLTRAIGALAAKYHTETAPDGRWHRLIVGAHPFATEGATHDG